MGDRCWFEVHVRREDAQPFRDLVFNGLDCEEDSPNDYYPHAVYFRDPEANYGHYNACQEAAEHGLVFEGSSGSGAEYGPAKFCGFDGEFHHIETLWDGAPALRYDENARCPDLSSVREIEAYLHAFQRVQNTLGDRSWGRP